ncbi:MAG: FKBP-type peptidyl-prolyl cis-trans isomerase [Treponema sp.]|nr:FKBP-type peptidyl-prolyl cis-trans isomerase [Treponema sp.]
MVNAIKQGDRIERVTIIRNGVAANAFKADQAAFDALLGQVNAAAANKVQAQRSADIARINAEYPNTAQTDSGIRYIVLKQGTGIKPAAGKIVRLNYTGRLLSGRVFDSSDIQGRPIQFPAGTGAVIPGWDEIVMDMNIGEKRLVIIPPELAYGSQEIGGVIPANSFLIFEMELIGIR